MAGRALTEAEWQGLLARAAGSEFNAAFYAVLTTGVVCRMGCPSRSPLRRNVGMFDDLPAALAAGFRPCKRCKPAIGSGPPAQEIGNQPQAGGL